MSSLLDLPAELVELVIEFTWPDDFENIALACKTTYSLSRERIKVHNRRKEIYKNLRYQCIGLLQTDLQLISTFDGNPEFARYIRNVDLNYGRFRMPEFYEPKWDWQKIPRLEDGHSLEFLQEFLASKDTPLSAKLRSKLQEASETYVEDNPLLAGDGSEMDELEPDMIIMDQEYALHPMGPLPTVALLAMMPNVQELRPPYEWSFLGDVEEHCHLFPAIDEFVRATNDHTVQQDWLPRGLKRIVAFEPCPQEEMINNLACLMPFMALQSVLHITAHNVVMRDFEWRYGNTLSNLQTLELIDGHVDADEIDKLLRYTPRLEVLRYGHGQKDGFDENDWDAAAFVHAVGKLTGGTLKEMSLACIDGFRVPSAGIESMKEFTALRKLELDLYFLYGLDEMEGVDRPAQTPRLTDFLPTPCNVRDLHLCHTSGRGPNKVKFDKILTDLLSLSAEQKTQLQDCAIEVMLEYDESQESPIAKVITDAGAKFVSSKQMEWMYAVDLSRARREWQLEELDEKAYERQEAAELASGVAGDQSDEVSEMLDETESGEEDDSHSEEEEDE